MFEKSVQIGLAYIMSMALKKAVFAKLRFDKNLK